MVIWTSFESILSADVTRATSSNMAKVSRMARIIFIVSNCVWKRMKRTKESPSYPVPIHISFAMIKPSGSWIWFFAFSFISILFPREWQHLKCRSTKMALVPPSTTEYKRLPQHTAIWFYVYLVLFSYST